MTVREGITKKLSREVFEHTPSASLTSVGLFPLGSIKVALDPTKRNNPEIRRIHQSDFQKSNYFESFISYYSYTTYTLQLQDGSTDMQ